MLWYTNLVFFLYFQTHHDEQVINNDDDNGRVYLEQKRDKLLAQAVFIEQKYMFLLSN